MRLLCRSSRSSFLSFMQVYSSKVALILMMHSILSNYPTEILKLVCVSFSVNPSSFNYFDRTKDIADVSHFVKENTAMDGEAAERGTTVYLVNKRIDMLPKLLGESKLLAVV